jgi:hypothetical protein
MKRTVCCVALALVFAGATPAMAQLPRFEIAPYVGAYIPLTNLLSEEIFLEEFTASQKTSLAVGGRVTAWLAGPLGLEGNFMYAFSDAESNDGTETSDTSAYVYAADARLVFRIGVPVAPVSFHISGGIALIGRGGDAYEEVTQGKTDVGGVVGLGTRIKLPGMFAIRVDADGFVYQSELTIDDVDLGEFTFDKQWQADLVLSAGLVIGFGVL